MPLQGMLVLSHDYSNLPFANPQRCDGACSRSLVQSNLFRSTEIGLAAAVHNGEQSNLARLPFACKAVLHKEIFSKRPVDNGETMSKRLHMPQLQPPFFGRVP